MHDAIGDDTEGGRANEQLKRHHSQRPRIHRRRHFETLLLRL